MRRTRVFLAVVLLLITASPAANAAGVISHNPPQAFVAGWTSRLEVKAPNFDRLQLYYREMGAESWSSVEVTNLGPGKESSVAFVVPAGSRQVEYFFITMSGHGVTATTRTSQKLPYRVPVIAAGKLRITS